MLPELKQNTLEFEELGAKLERAFLSLKRKTVERGRKRKRGNANWNPKLGDKVLVKCQNQSGAARGVIDTVMHV